MLLYHDTRAPNPRRVRIFLAEKNVAYDTIEVSIASHANETEDFKKKNPLQILPVLELADGRILRESMAICRFLEEEHPEPNLWGRDSWERATIEMWNRHAELELLIPTASIFRNTHQFWAGRITQCPAYGNYMREILGARRDWLNDELGKREYLAGDRFTVADITAVCALDFGKVVNERIDAAKHPHLAAWHARIAARPSYKA